MDKTVTINLGSGQWSLRARLYAVSLAVTGGYFFYGNLNNHGESSVPMNLPLTGLVVLALCLAAAETILSVRRFREKQAELDATRARELELQQRWATQQHQMLNQISRELLDKLDMSQVPAAVLDKIAQLFDADLVAIWVLDKQRPQQFNCRGVVGLQAHQPDDITGVAWTFPQADGVKPTQLVIAPLAREISSTLAAACQREAIEMLVLNPIIQHEVLAGIVGVCFRKAVEPAAAQLEMMQTVTQVVAGAVQAEELYHDLVRMQKIESVGTLASGIAHDFNNILAAILACATYCKQHTDPDSQSYRYLEATEASAHRGAALTKQLLSFVRREEPKLQVVNVNEHVENTLNMLERSLDKSIMLQRQYATNVKPVEVDPSMLEQVILNLAVNARDAMPTGGFFHITTKNIGLHQENPYRPEVALPDGEYVVLGFRDTGCGMEAKTIQRIFEPFFTTKRPGKGTGLGLSLIMNIVHNFGGEIRVESTVGVGTLFEVYLPASTKPLPLPDAQRAGIVRGGGETILIAEDEEIIREMAQLNLEAKGYHVLTAADGAAAVARYREGWQKINLVIVDMAMPRMSGPEVFEAMKKINPGVCVIVSSGYSHDQEGQRMLQHGCLGFLQKPYNGDQLCQAVRTVLDSGL